ncbi:MAG: DUF4831 family protein [Bacteroidales bacterium]
MRDFKIVLSALLILATVSCSKQTTTVSPVNQVSSLSPKGVVYALPKTIFNLKINVTQTTIIPGPYAKFAQKYLGINDAPTARESSWEISDISLNPYTEPDMDALYVIEPASDFSIDYLTLTTKGLIIPISNADFYEVNQQQASSFYNEQMTDFTDLSPTPFIASQRTTHYSRVFQDSTYVRVPVHKNVVVERSLEEKAKEAADFIFSLRSRRFELISGDADFLVEGKAVETVFNEIARLEEEYLSLFIGKKIVRENTHNLNYTPSSDHDSASILFRFSSSRGILPSSDLSGSPVLISFTKDTDWSSVNLFNQLSTEKDEINPSSVYYRLPVPAIIKINDSNKEYLSQKHTVLQFGPVVRMPAKFITDIANKIIFPKEEE